MSLKESYHIIITNSNQPELVQRRISKNFGPKKISNHDDFTSNAILGHPLKRPCARCNKQEALLSCFQCSQNKFCTDCDKNLHQFGKFVSHRRDLLPPLIQIQNSFQSQMHVTKASKGMEQNEKQLRVRKATINISQGWNLIISQISIKFQQIIDSLQDRKKQIQSKLEAKRQQQIKSYVKAIEQLSGTENKVKLDCQQRNIKRLFNQRSEYFDTKIRMLTQDNQLIEKKLQKKYKIMPSLFQQIQNSVSKLEIKSILNKISEQPPIQTAKKPMKSSLIIGGCPSYALSPGTKTPKNGKSQLSLSTVEGDVKQSSQIASRDREKQENGSKLSLYYSKQTKLLSKVRSEKLFCKSPSNVQQKLLIKQKTTKKKMEQIGIMI